MSFFEGLPEPRPDVPMRRYVEPEWRRVPHELVPAQLPMSQLVHATDALALVFCGVSVYPSGLTCSLVASMHPEAPLAEQPMHEVLHGGPRRTGGQLRMGVLHADGARASYPDFGAGPRPGPPQACISSRGGGGTHDAASAEYFVWPLPVEGDLTLLFQWLAADLTEARITIPGDALREAASRAIEIWPGAQMPPAAEGGDGGLIY